MPDKTKVSTGKAKTTGSVHRAPAGTSLPTDATTALANTFVDLGYISKEGLTNSAERTTASEKAWGGDIVAIFSTDKTDKFKFKFIESLNADVLKSIYGASNVTVTTTQISIAEKNIDPEFAVWVFDMILKTGGYKRIVVPEGAIVSVGDIVYVDEGLIGYEVTIDTLADASGNTHYEYISIPTTGSGGAVTP